MTTRPALLAALALCALPAVATAHNATIACDVEHPGAYVVTPDFLRLNPVTSFGPTSATVVWSDGYRVTLPYPSGCVVPVVPTTPVSDAPAPQQPDAPQAVSAPPVDAPQVITPGRPEPGIRKKATPRKVTCKWLRAHKAGKWSYIRRGFYPGCRAPKPRIMRRIAVTG